MLLVWISMIPCVPAMIAVLERIQARLPPALRQPPPRLDDDGSRGLLSRVVGDATARRPKLFVGIAVVLRHDLDDAERARVMELRPPETLRVLMPEDLPDSMKRRFAEASGTVGTAFYVRYGGGVSLSDGHNLLRIAKATYNVELPDGTRVLTASRSTIFAEMIRAMERDGPLATFASFFAVLLVVIAATANVRGTTTVIASLVLGVVWMLGLAAWGDEKLNFLNFIALPITFGIGSEYPFNIYDRSRLLRGDVTQAVKLHLGAVALCSYTTVIGYGSLVLADNQALQSFGRLAMVGELACLYGALFFLPSLLHLWRARR